MCVLNGVPDPLRLTAPLAQRPRASAQPPAFQRAFRPLFFRHVRRQRLALHTARPNTSNQLQSSRGWSTQRALRCQPENPLKTKQAFSTRQTQETAFDKTHVPASFTRDRQDQISSDGLIEEILCLDKSEKISSFKEFKEVQDNMSCLNILNISVLCAVNDLSVRASRLKQTIDNAFLQVLKRPLCHHSALNVRPGALQIFTPLGLTSRPTPHRTPRQTEGCGDGAHPAKTGSSATGQAAHARTRRCGLPFVPPACAPRPTRRPPLGAQIAWWQRHRGFAPHLPPPNSRPVDRNRAGQALQHHRGLANANRDERLFEVGQNQTTRFF